MKLCNFETSKALHELGYDGEHKYFYHPNGKLDSLIDYLVLNKPVTVEHVPAPRLDDAAYWIRVKHRLSVEVVYHPAYGKWLGFVIDFSDKAVVIFKALMDIYDDAFESSVINAIQIISSKK